MQYARCESGRLSSPSHGEEKLCTCWTERTPTGQVNGGKSAHMGDGLCDFNLSALDEAAVFVCWETVLYVGKRL